MLKKRFRLLKYGIKFVIINGFGRQGTNYIADLVPGNTRFFGYLFFSNFGRF